MRRSYEAFFDADLSGVRIHTDAAANHLADATRATAVTHGPNIYFAANRFDPQSKQGRKLLAHELAHVMQERAGMPAALRRDPALPAGADRSEEDEKLLKTLQAAPELNVINFASRYAGLIGWKRDLPRSYEEMRPRAVKAYTQPAFDKLVQKDAELLPLVQKSEQVMAKLRDLATEYSSGQKPAAGSVVDFYTGHYQLSFAPLGATKVRGFYEIDYAFFGELFKAAPDADLALLRMLLDRDVDAIIKAVREQAQLAQEDEDKKRAERRGWAAEGAAVLGQRVARKTRMIPWSTNMNLESVLAPDYGSTDPQEMLAVARMSGLCTAVVKVKERNFTYKLDEQYSRKDFYLLPDKDAFLQIEPAGGLQVLAITSTGGFVITPPANANQTYGAGDQQDNPLKSLEADTKLLESGRAAELGITPLTIFQSMVMNLALVNLKQADDRMRSIESRYTQKEDPNSYEGDKLKKDVARLHATMLSLVKLADEIKDEPTDDQGDRRDALIQEMSELLERNPGAAMFVANKRDPDSKDAAADSDVENKLGDAGGAEAAQKAIDEAKRHRENIAKVRRALFENPSLALGFDVLHPMVLARFSEADRSSIKLGLFMHTLDEVSKTLQILSVDLVLLLAGFVTGGETWLGLAVHGGGVAFGAYQLGDQIKHAQLVASMSQVDVEGGNNLATAGEARSARNWAIFGAVMNFLAIAGLARTANKLIAAGAREANLVSRLASRAGVGEEVLALALRKNWRGVPDPDPNALRRILLSGMESNVAKRYENIPLKVLTEEDWIARFGKNSPAQAVTNFIKNAAGETVATEVLFRRSGSILSLEEEAAHIQQAVDPKWAAKLASLSTAQEGWASLGAVEKLKATRTLLEVEIDANRRLLERARFIGDTESMDTAAEHIEELASRLADVEDKFANPSSTRYLAWFDPAQPPTVFSTPRLPREVGSWKGTPGNSVWESTNPQVKEIVGASGRVRFRNGYPDFSPWSRGQITLGEMSGYADDFAEADAAFAKGVINRTRECPQGFTREQFMWRGEPNASTTKLYRQQVGLTWHHHQGGKLMMLIPTKLHANIPHTGGASAARAAPL